MTTKREYRNRIVVKAQLPRNAFSTMPEDTEIEVLSTHTPTLFGVRGALRKEKMTTAEYSQSHGNRAACAVWCEFNGQKLDLDALDLMIQMPAKFDRSNFLEQYNEAILTMADVTKMMAEEN